MPCTKKRTLCITTTQLQLYLQESLYSLYISLYFQEFPQRSSLKLWSNNSHDDFLSGSGEIYIVLTLCFILKWMDPLQHITHFVGSVFAQIVLFAIATNRHFKKSIIWNKIWQYIIGIADGNTIISQKMCQFHKK